MRLKYAELKSLKSCLKPLKLKLHFHFTQQRFIMRTFIRFLTIFVDRCWWVTNGDGYFDLMLVTHKWSPGPSYLGLTIALIIPTQSPSILYYNMRQLLRHRIYRIHRVQLWKNACLAFCLVKSRLSVFDYRDLLFILNTERCCWSFHFSSSTVELEAKKKSVFSWLY